MDSIFIKEATLLFDWMICGRKDDDLEQAKEKAKEIKKEFSKTPLSKLAPSSNSDFKKTCKQIAGYLKTITEVL